MRAALVVALFAVTSGIEPQQTFRAGVDLVHFSVIVTDKEGAPVTGLKAEDFEVVEEGRPQTISYFSEGSPTAAISAGCCRCTSGWRSTPAAAWRTTSTTCAPA